MVVFAAHIVGNISIHAPRGGSDNRAREMYISSLTFQSTLPVGGATAVEKGGEKCTRYFNPRSPWGERHVPLGMAAAGLLFQSTLPVGGATITQANTLKDTLFQSTLPVGGATCAEDCGAI